MFLFLMTPSAHATGFTRCGAKLLPSEQHEVRILMSCAGSASAPGGPASHFGMDVPDVPLSVWLRGMEIAPLERSEEREDRTAVYSADLTLSPGLPYQLRGADPIGSQAIHSAPDVTSLSRCFTNPDTCLSIVDAVPDELGPALRLQACVGRQTCEPARKDPVADAVRQQVALSCLSGNPLACDWMMELEPDLPWSMVDLNPPGRGKLVATGVRFVLQPAGTEPRALTWTDEIPSHPLISDGGDDTLPTAVGPSGLEVRRNDKAVEIWQRRKKLWSWAADEVDGAALRRDGKQLLVRKGRLMVWVAFDQGNMPPIEGMPSADHGVRRAGSVIRADGWPAAGIRVSVPCDASDRAFSCAAITDLLGRYALAGLQGSSIRVEDPSGTLHDLVVVSGLPTRIPETDRVFDFEVDPSGTVTRATEPLRVGDQVVSIGPLPVEGEPIGADPLPTPLWDGLATSWGSVEVVRDGSRLTLP